MAVIQLTLSFSDKTLNRLPSASDEPLPKSVAKCDALDALPPLPNRKNLPTLGVGLLEFEDDRLDLLDRDGVGARLFRLRCS